MRSVNPEHIRAIIELMNQGPYYRLLSLRVKVLEAGYALVEADLEEKHLNPFGGLHGGVYSSVIDTAAYWAVYSELDEDLGLVSLDLRVDNLATASRGRLTVEGRRISMGRRLGLASAEVKDDRGRLLAQGTSKLMITPGLQTVAQAAQFLGYGPLPPKFLDS